MAIKVIFGTVGTTKFDDFVSTITSNEILNVLKSLNCEKLVLQIGSGNVVPDQIPGASPEICWYRYKDDLKADIQEADLVISHAGAGSILEALEADKKLLVVVNESLMDNHQFELAAKMQEEGHLIYTTCRGLKKTLETMDLSTLKPYPKSDGQLFSQFLNRLMGFDIE